MLQPETLFQHINTYQEEIELIAFEEIQGGGIAFGKDELNRIHAVKTRKAANRYIYIMNTIAMQRILPDYNSYYSEVFESEKMSFHLVSGKRVLCTVLLTLTGGKML